MTRTYTMLVFFSGRGEQIGHAASFFSSHATGRIIGAASTGDLSEEEALQVPCADAHFDTVVMFRGDQSYEAGRVYFPGIESYIDVETYTSGRVDARDDGTSTGSIAWSVTGGGGTFANAKGIVTGNFVGYPDGTFSDHQLYKLVLSHPGCE
jgi:hypothetical protein